MKIYIAARYARRFELRKVANLLNENGFQVTSQWLYNGEESKGQREAALMDLADVDKADAVLFFAEPYGSENKGGGRYFEIGYAYAKNKFVIVVCSSEKFETVFQALPEIHNEVNEYYAISRLTQLRNAAIESLSRGLAQSG